MANGTDQQSSHRADSTNRSDSTNRADSTNTDDVCRWTLLPGPSATLAEPALEPDLVEDAAECFPVVGLHLGLEPEHGVEMRRHLTPDEIDPVYAARVGDRDTWAIADTLDGVFTRSGAVRLGRRKLPVGLPLAFPDHELDALMSLGPVTSATFAVHDTEVIAEPVDGRLIRLLSTIWVSPETEVQLPGILRCLHWFPPEEGGWDRAVLGRHLPGAGLIVDRLVDSDHDLAVELADLSVDLRCYHRCRNLSRLTTTQRFQVAGNWLFERESDIPITWRELPIIEALPQPHSGSVEVPDRWAAEHAARTTGGRRGSSGSPHGRSDGNDPERDDGLNDGLSDGKDSDGRDSDGRDSDGRDSDGRDSDGLSDGRDNRGRDDGPGEPTDPSTRSRARNAFAGLPVQHHAVPVEQLRDHLDAVRRRPALAAERAGVSTALTALVAADSLRRLPMTPASDLPIGAAARDEWIHDRLRAAAGRRRGAHAEVVELAARVDRTERPYRRDGGFPDLDDIRCTVRHCLEQELGVPSSQVDVDDLIASVSAAITATAAAGAPDSLWGHRRAGEAPAVLAAAAVSLHRTALVTSASEAAQMAIWSTGAADRLSALLPGRIGPLGRDVRGEPISTSLRDPLTALVGPPGTGKTSTLLDCMAHGSGPAVIVTTKHEDVSPHHLALLRDLYGSVQVISTSGLPSIGWGATVTRCSWDPLHQPLAPGQAARLVERIHRIALDGRVHDSRERFWDNLAQSLARPTALAASVETDALELLRRWIETVDRQAVTCRLQDRDLDDAAEQYEAITSTHPGVTIDSVRLSAMAAYHWVDGDILRPALSTHAPFDPARFVERTGAVVILVDSTAEASTVHASLLVAELVDAQLRAWDEARSRRHLHLYVDELASVGLNGFARSLGELSGRGVNGVVAFQSARQLLDAFGPSGALYVTTTTNVTFPGADLADLGSSASTPTVDVGEVCIDLPGQGPVVVRRADAHRNPLRRAAMLEAFCALPWI